MGKRLLVSNAVFLLVLALACGGDTDQDGLISSGTPDPVAGDPKGALAASGERLTAAQSGQSKFSWEIDRDGFHLEGNGEYAVKSPDGMSLKAHYQGEGDVPQQFREENDSELIVLAQSVYLKTPVFTGDDWVLLTPEEFGADWEVVQRLVTNRSPLNYGSVSASAGSDLSSTGSDSIDGRDYLRYATSFDAGTLMDALADAYGSQGQVILANRFSGPIPTELWLDPVTLLPRRLRAEGQFTFMDSSTQLALSVDFLDLNGDVELPDAPDAIPLADLAE